MKGNIKRGNFKARLVNSAEGEILVKVDIINYIEDNICYVFCPALDITGYGHTEAAANKSFEITLLEYIKYTTHKKTLKKDLLALGWKDTRHGEFKAPSLSYLISKEENLQELVDNATYQKTSRNIELPALA
jgi:hypothetical protein